MALFVFFVPVVYMTSYPVFCTTSGHPCVGDWTPVTGSISYWLFGWGGAYLKTTWITNLPPMIANVTVKYYITWP